MLTENPTAGGFIISLANANRSMDNVTIQSGQDLKAGTVLGKEANSDDYVQLDPSATDGTDVARGVLFAPTDTTDGEVVAAVVLRDAEVNAGELIWPTGISDNDKATAIGELKTIGIIVRTGVS